MKRQEIIERCNQALEGMRGQLPASLHQEACDLINEHNEWGLAIEFVIDWIDELEIEITLEQFRKIEAAMTGMGRGESDRMVWLRTHRVAPAVDHLLANCPSRPRCCSTS